MPRFPTTIYSSARVHALWRRRSIRIRWDAASRSDHGGLFQSVIHCAIFTAAPCQTEWFFLRDRCASSFQSEAAGIDQADSVHKRRNVVHSRMGKNAHFVPLISKRFSYQSKKPTAAGVSCLGYDAVVQLFLKEMVGNTSNWPCDFRPKSPRWQVQVRGDHCARVVNVNARVR